MMMLVDKKFCVSIRRNKIADIMLEKTKHRYDIMRKYMKKYKEDKWK
jgi:hypothetical protein